MDAAESAARYRAVFVDTSLDTKIAIAADEDDTVTDLKKKIQCEHALYFPDIGEIDIKSMQGKCEGAWYHLPDSMPVALLFDGFSRKCLVHVDACRWVKHDTEASVPLDNDNGVLCCLEYKTLADRVDYQPNEPDKTEGKENGNDTADAVRKVREVLDDLEHMGNDQCRTSSSETNKRVDSEVNGNNFPDSESGQIGHVGKKRKMDGSETQVDKNLLNDQAVTAKKKCKIQKKEKCYADRSNKRTKDSTVDASNKGVQNDNSIQKLTEPTSSANRTPENEVVYEDNLNDQSNVNRLTIGPTNTIVLPNGDDVVHSDHANRATSVAKISTEGKQSGGPDATAAPLAVAPNEMSEPSVKRKKKKTKVNTVPSQLLPTVSVPTKVHESKNLKDASDSHQADAAVITNVKSLGTQKMKDASLDHEPFNTNQPCPVEETKLTPKCPEKMSLEKHMPDAQGYNHVVETPQVLLSDGGVVPLKSGKKAKKEKKDSESGRKKKVKPVTESVETPRDEIIASQNPEGGGDVVGSDARCIGEGRSVLDDARGIDEPDAQVVKAREANPEDSQLKEISNPGNFVHAVEKDKKKSKKKRSTAAIPSEIQNKESIDMIGRDKSVQENNGELAKHRLVDGLNVTGKVTGSVLEEGVAKGSSVQDDARGINEPDAQVVKAREANPEASQLKESSNPGNLVHAVEKDKKKSKTKRSNATLPSEIQLKESIAVNSRDESATVNNGELANRRSVDGSNVADKVTGSELAGGASKGSSVLDDARGIDEHDAQVVEAREANPEASQFKESSSPGNLVNAVAKEKKKSKKKRSTAAIPSEIQNKESVDMIGRDKSVQANNGELAKYRSVDGLNVSDEMTGSELAGGPSKRSGVLGDARGTNESDTQVVKVGEANPEASQLKESSNIGNLVPAVEKNKKKPERKRSSVIDSAETQFKENSFLKSSSQSTDNMNDRDKSVEADKGESANYMSVDGLNETADKNIDKEVASAGTVTVTEKADAFQGPGKHLDSVGETTTVADKTNHTKPSSVTDEINFSDYFVPSQQKPTAVASGDAVTVNEEWITVKGKSEEPKVRQNSKVIPDEKKSQVESSQESLSRHQPHGAVLHSDTESFRVSKDRAPSTGGKQKSKSSSKTSKAISEVAAPHTNSPTTSETQKSDSSRGTTKLNKNQSKAVSSRNKLKPPSGIQQTNSKQAASKKSSTADAVKAGNATNKRKTLLSTNIFEDDDDDDDESSDSDDDDESVHSGLSAGTNVEDSYVSDVSEMEDDTGFTTPRTLGQRLAAEAENDSSTKQYTLEMLREAALLEKAKRNKDSGNEFDEFVPDSQLDETP